MTVPLEGSDIIAPLLLVKAVLAILAVFLFLYYRANWERAKRHLPVHFFFAKWRAAKHAFVLGLAAVGFAAGFTLEIFGGALGMSPNLARFASSVFEIGSLAAMLLVFFELVLQDVPHFQHVSESAAQHRHARIVAEQKPVGKKTAKRKAGKKKAGGRKGKA